MSKRFHQFSPRPMLGTRPGVAFDLSTLFVVIATVFQASGDLAPFMTLAAAGAAATKPQ